MLEVIRRMIRFASMRQHITCVLHHNDPSSKGEFVLLDVHVTLSTLLQV